MTPLVFKLSVMLDFGTGVVLLLDDRFLVFDTSAFYDAAFRYTKSRKVGLRCVLSPFGAANWKGGGKAVNNLPDHAPNTFMPTQPLPPSSVLQRGFATVMCAQMALKAGQD